MNPSGHHHIAMRVSDIDRGIAFYRDAFGAEVLALPFPIEGDFAEVVARGPAGVRWRTAILSVGDAGIELFEFDHPREPIVPVHMTQGNLLHFAIEVDDVPAALSRVEAAGGRRLWPDVVDLGDGAQVIYVLDPDENVIELLNADRQKIADLMIRAYPEAAP